jgi:hypothetical protein
VVAGCHYLSFGDILKGALAKSAADPLLTTRRRCGREYPQVIASDHAADEEIQPGILCPGLRFSPVERSAISYDEGVNRRLSARSSWCRSCAKPGPSPVYPINADLVVFDADFQVAAENQHSNIGHVPRRNVLGWLKCRSSRPVLLDGDRCREGAGRFRKFRRSVSSNAFAIYGKKSKPLDAKASNQLS